jgi:DNA-binding NtrC family response regulator
MKPLGSPTGSDDLSEVVDSFKPVGVVKQSASMDAQPTFTLTFALAAPMREIEDAVMSTILQFCRGNRLRAAQLLDINPRTIRRRLGKKHSPGAMVKAA